MPLVHSSSKAALKTNIGTLMHEVGRSPHVKSPAQALAVAYSVKRRSRAGGGLTPFKAPSMNPSFATKAEAHGMHAGPILSAVAGRTDHHPMNVAAGSYVLPSDHVSSLGQGNSVSGMAVLNHMFGGAGPYGVGRDVGIKHGAGAPAVPKLGKLASGGASDSGGARGDGSGSPTPIMAAGGEYVIPPHVVTAIGSGDIKRGHAILDHWVKSNRKQHVKTLKSLPGPAKS